jgi:hypothetical protein
VGRHQRTRRSLWLWSAALSIGVLLVGAAAVALAERTPPGRAHATVGVTTSSGPSTPPPASASPLPTRSAATGTPAPTTRPRLIFGLGTEADSAMSASLTRQAPIRMLTSWYNGPGDLDWMPGWRTSTVPKAYRANYAMHLIVYSGDSEGALSTSYGPACGRAYPLSARFASDMTTLAKTFAGPKSGPPLYVTMFTEFQTYPCQDNAWSPDTQTTNYYKALQDQYRTAYGIFHRYAPNARVSLGWGGWQASFDDPSHGGGRSLFPHFADLMRMSDFQSFQAMDSHSNVADIADMVSILGQYGPVMLAHYKPDDGSQSTFDNDLHAIMTDTYLATQVRNGLFAMSFMDTANITSSSSLAFVTAAVTRYGRGW